jgi:hypothetical protein
LRLLAGRASKHLPGHLRVEAQAWLRAGPKLDSAKFGTVGIDPGAIDSELGGECRRIDKPPSSGGATFVVDQLNHPLRHGLNGCRVKNGSGRRQR